MESEKNRLLDELEKHLRYIIDDCVKNHAESSAELLNDINEQVDAIRDISDVDIKDWRKLKFLKKKRLKTSMGGVKDAILEIHSKVLNRPESLSYIDYTKLDQFSIMKSSLPKVIEKILIIPSTYDDVYDFVKTIIADEDVFVPKFSPTEHDSFLSGILEGISEGYMEHKKKEKVLSLTGMSDTDYDNFFIKQTKKNDYISNLSEYISSIHTNAREIQRYSLEVVEQMRRLSVRDNAITNSHLVQIFNNERQFFFEQYASDYCERSFNTIMHFPEITDQERFSELIKLTQRLFINIQDILVEMKIKHSFDESSFEYIHDLYKASVGYDLMAAYYLYSGSFSFFCRKIDEMKAQNPDLVVKSDAYSNITNIHVNGGNNNFGEGSQMIKTN